jgi:phosphoserine phosphatase RsbU/P
MRSGTAKSRHAWIYAARVERMGRAGVVVPLAIIVLFSVLDVAAGPGRVVSGLVVIAPWLAASLLGWRATVWYAVLALIVAALLGLYDEQYTADEWPTQAARLFGVALGGLIAVAVCRSRLEREDQLQQLGVSTALAQEQARGAQDMAGLAEWLQRSLLTPPPPVAELEIAAAYAPAADHVKIGGDWYDVFPAPGDRTLVVIGDVAGHDGAAAATMAQVRNVLRGMGQVLLAPPATLLTALDRAVRSFLPTVMATMIVIEISHLGRNSGPLVLRWSNAGHPPPLLISGEDGTAQLLEREPDLLLGVDPNTRRADHELVLYQGDTVVLYTDGLVERRGATLDEGLARLRDVAEEEAGLPLDKLCEVLLVACTERPDDDIAVLALRARAR